MCLYYDAQVTKQMRSTMRQDKAADTRIFYKEYDQSIDVLSNCKLQLQLKPRWFNRNGKTLITKPGWIKSNRKSRKLTGHECRKRVVNRGIHVYLYDSFFIPSRRDTLVRVSAKAEDLIGVSEDGEAVFMKVHIDKKEWERLIELHRLGKIGSSF